MASTLHAITLQPFGVSDTQKTRQQKTREEGKIDVPGRKEETSSHRHSHCEVLLHEAAVAEQPSPQLHPDDAEDEEDKEAEKKDIPQHGQGVQEQVHKDAHACRRRREPEGASVGWRDREREREEKKREGEGMENLGDTQTCTQKKVPHKDKSRVSEINYCPNQARFLIVALSFPDLY